MVRLVIEGAGGLMVPLTRQTLFIDVFARWQIPLILCARTALGTINHTLLSIEAIRARDIPLQGVAFIGEANEESEGIIAEIGPVKRLGRLPPVAPLTREQPALRSSPPTSTSGISREFSRLASLHPACADRRTRPWCCAAKVPGWKRKKAALLDAISSWWVITHGHRHPKIVEAIRKQTEELDQVIFAGFTHQPAEDLARALVEIAPPGLAHVFYSDSGSTAVEVALKMALGFWKNRNKQRSRIIALEHAYHGDTIGTMSAGARGVFNAAYEPLLFDVVRLPFPAPGREQETLDALATLPRQMPPP